MKDNKFRNKAPKANIDRGTTIYVGNLRYTKSQKDIKTLFERFGKVKAVNLITDLETNKSKGIAFVNMPDKNEAEKAIFKLNGAQDGGRTLKVSIAKDRVVHPTANFKSKRDEKFEAEEKVKEKRPKRKKRNAGLNELFDYLKNK